MRAMRPADERIAELESLVADLWEHNLDLETWLAELKAERLSQNPWISVEDRLPESGDKYLVLLNNGQSHFATWVSSALTLSALETNSPYWAIGIDEISNVTHWMEIPPIPEVKT